MRRWIVPLALVAAATIGPAATANDSAAEMAAGGLVLRQNRDIDMVSEDLYVSQDEIRVRYVFRNRSPRDVRTIVAFPLPDMDLANEPEGDVSWPGEFRTRVDGRAVRMSVERRAVLNGTDHSALLRSLNVPISGHEDVSPMYRAVDDLPAAAQDRLAQVGLIELGNDPSAGRRMASPRWTVRESWYWEQVFPAGRDIVVEHRYRPGAGGTVTSALMSPEYRDGEGAREWIARYCIEPSVLAAIDRMTARRVLNIDEVWLSYILTTGANWRSPIADFRLVVDKGRPENLVSFCGEGVRRISPTQFEMRRRNWRPDRDLNVLILRPSGAE